MGLRQGPLFAPVWKRRLVPYLWWHDSLVSVSVIPPGYPHALEPGADLLFDCRVQETRPARRIASDPSRRQCHQVSSTLRTHRTASVRLILPALARILGHWISPATYAVAVVLGVAGGAEAQVTVIENGATPRFPGCALQLAEDLRIGSLDGDGMDVFGAIGSYAASPDGSLIVVDGLGVRVSVFSADGGYAFDIGRRGEGPGEYTAPSRVFLGERGTYIYDRGLRRIQLYRPNGTYVTGQLLPRRTLSQPSFAAAPDGSILWAAVHIPQGLAEPQAFPVLHRLSTEMSLLGSFGAATSFGRGDAADRLQSYLGNGSIEIKTNGQLWYLPFALYEIQLFSRDGTLLRRVSRLHSFDLQGIGFVHQVALEGRRTETSGRLTGAIIPGLDLDEAGRIWVFVRNIPLDQMVIDVYDAEGDYLWRFEEAMGSAPTRLGSGGTMLRATQENGYPQLIRLQYDVVDSSTGEVCR